MTVCFVCVCVCECIYICNVPLAARLREVDVNVVQKLLRCSSTRVTDTHSTTRHMCVCVCQPGTQKHARSFVRTKIHTHMGTAQRSVSSHEDTSIHMDMVLAHRRSTCISHPSALPQNHTHTSSLSPMTLAQAKRTSHRFIERSIRGNGVLLRDNLPELGAHLVSSLSGLNVHNFPHPSFPSSSTSLSLPLSFPLPLAFF